MFCTSTSSDDAALAPLKEKKPINIANSHAPYLFLNLFILFILLSFHSLFLK